ncbi:unnamed protein product [Penicillium salamii]|uniref:Protein kinase domain-containing protein n=1 Tax=Penicillium salamii TaxID=1612424 RepID=A0A9W4IDY6_9EURO|nr:unnamed protein product [Penicillium salamii]CAG8094987.1 unnamed protein product [Penicillium salamii]CAG8121345.1 unnamed protein product [Penicillium salamii]CAG8151391.1 unnamed protein product [Penicillium salamii]CAG8268214.1 unnamed protein product [Penicillium salamii]
MIINFQRKGFMEPPKSKDIESSDLTASASITETYTYTVRLVPQHNLEIIGVGASSQVYKVNDNIVLKTSRVFERPGPDASPRDQWNYASDTIFHSNLLKNERTVFRILQRRPHPNLASAIDPDQPEGIYIRRYRAADPKISLSQPQRIKLYCSITDALRHLHSLKIVHADVRVDNIVEMGVRPNPRLILLAPSTNILFDDQDSAILCDFSASSPCGEPNLVFPDLPLPLNDPAAILSEATDMFAMASLIYQMEHGVSPVLSIAKGALALPEMNSGIQSLDDVVRNAWLGKYTCTKEMLRHLASIDAQTNHCSHGALLSPRVEDSLGNQVQVWRRSRENTLGTVLEGLLSEDQLQALADCNGMDMNADLHFAHYEMPASC